jgi:1,2-diacylglycerol 3-beta-galactosyltransferase
MSEPKRILILTADAGFGHRSASNAIKAAFHEKYPECLVEIINPLNDPRTPILLRNTQSDYDKIIRDVPDLYKLGYEASDAAVPIAIAESAMVVLQYIVMREIVQKHNPDAIITTYPLYQAPLNAIFTINRRYIPLLTVITDLVTVHRMWFNDGADYVFVATEYVKNLAIENGIDPQRIYLTGIPVHPDISRKVKDVQSLRMELGWQPNLITLLAVGSKRVENLPGALEILNHSGLPIQLIIVTGGDEELYKKMIESDWHVPAHIYNYVDNMPTLLKAADCVISKAGGLITTESLACGLPLILTDIIPGQETGNAMFIVEQGAGEIAKSPQDVLEIVFHWLMNDAQGLHEAANKAKSIGRPNAAYAIADLAYKAALSGPFQKRERNPKLILSIRELLDKFGIPFEDKK